MKNLIISKPLRVAKFKDSHSNATNNYLELAGTCLITKLITMKIILTTYSNSKLKLLTKANIAFHIGGTNETCLFWVTTDYSI